MNMNENEKQYYDKIVVLYGKYGENIPDADLMHLSVIEKELGISFQRSQVIFELVKSQAKLEKEAKVSAIVEGIANGSQQTKTMTSPEIHSISDAEDEDLIPVEDPGDINKWKVIFWYTIGFFAILLWGTGLFIMLLETVVIFRHKNKQLRYAKYLIQRYKIKQ